MPDRDKHYKVYWYLTTQDPRYRHNRVERKSRIEESSWRSQRFLGGKEKHAISPEKFRHSENSLIGAILGHNSSSDFFFLSFFFLRREKRKEASPEINKLLLNFQCKEIRKLIYSRSHLHWDIAERPLAIPMSLG